MHVKFQQFVLLSIPHEVDSRIHVSTKAYEFRNKKLHLKGQGVYCICDKERKFVLGISMTTAKANYVLLFRMRTN